MKTIIDTKATLENVVQKGLAKGYLEDLDKIGKDFKTHHIFRVIDGQGDFESIYQGMVNLSQGVTHLLMDTFLRELFIEYIEEKNPEVIERVVY